MTLYISTVSSHPIIWYLYVLQNISSNKNYICHLVLTLQFNIMWKRKELKYRYHKNRNKKGQLLPINSKEVSLKIRDIKPAPYA